MREIVAIKKVKDIEECYPQEIHGTLLWEDTECFGIEFDVTNGESDVATMTCYHNEWDLFFVDTESLVYNENF